MHACMYVHVCMYVCMYACMFVQYVCMYVYPSIGGVCAIQLVLVIVIGRLLCW